MNQSRAKLMRVEPELIKGLFINFAWTNIDTFCLDNGFIPHEYPNLKLKTKLKEITSFLLRVHNRTIYIANL